MSKPLEILPGGIPHPGQGCIEASLAWNGLISYREKTVHHLIKGSRLDIRLLLLSGFSVFPSTSVRRSYSLDVVLV